MDWDEMYDNRGERESRKPLVVDYDNGAIWIEGIGVVIKEPKVVGVTTTETIAKMCETYESEIARLRAELEQLKPKPVVEVRYVSTASHHTHFQLSRILNGGFDNLKLTFHDGVLVSAEVIK